MHYLVHVPYRAHARLLVHCTLCTLCHTRHWQATAPRHPISARLQQQHIAEQGDPTLTESVKPLSGTTKKDSAAHKAKKAAADRSASKKKDASHLEEDTRLAKTKHKKKKKNSAAPTEEPTEEPTGDNNVVSTPTYTAEYSYPGLGSNYLLPQMYDDAYDGYDEEEMQLSEEEPCPIAEGTEGEDAVTSR